MLFSILLLLVAAFDFLSAELVVDGNCKDIRFQRLFTKSPTTKITKGYGHIYDDPTETNANENVYIFPGFEEHFNAPVSLLIYKKRDSKFISNLPKNIKDVESWDDSFGICTQEDINLGKCGSIGQFKLELIDQSVQNRIINKFLHFRESNYGGLKALLIELEMGSFCYITAFDDVEKSGITKEKENSPLMKQKNKVLLFATGKTEKTIVHLNYYGYIISLVIQLLLGISICFKIKSDKKNYSQKSKLSTPYECCFAITIIFFITSALHLLYSRNILLTKDSMASSDLRIILRRILPILEALDGILIYLLCFQFVNLDKFGRKISLRKHKYGFFFIGILIWKLIVHPLIIDYSHNILFKLNKSFPEEEISGFFKIAIIILRASDKILNFFSYITIWLILYRTSQESENKFLVTNNSLKEYTQKFKLTRIWLAFSVTILKFSGFILSRFIYNLVFKFTKHIGFEIEEHAYRGGLKSILSHVVLIVLKGLLSVLKCLDSFALPILIIITLRIWWNYDGVKTEDIEMDNLVN